MLSRSSWLGTPGVDRSDERKDSNGLVERRGHKFSACWSEVDVQDCADMVFVNHLGVIWLSHVESVALGVFAAYNKIHWLLGIPANRCGLVFQVNFVDWGISSDIIKTNCSIYSNTG